MFSGIIENMATVVAVKRDKENIDLTLECPFAGELSIDQSVAHNGVCLTVVALEGNTYTVTAMKETLDRSNLGLLKEGDKVNVERSMMLNGRLDGHIVQGHVDRTAPVLTNVMLMVPPTILSNTDSTARWLARATSLSTRVRSLSMVCRSLSVSLPTTPSPWLSFPILTTTPTSAT